VVCFVWFSAGMVGLEKISESCLMTSTCASPTAAIGDNGEGFRMAQQRSMAARMMAASAEESAAILP
jgi:hypothetical protein